MNSSTAPCFPVSRHEKTWSRKFGGDGKNYGEVSKKVTETEVSA